MKTLLLHPRTFLLALLALLALLFAAAPAMAQEFPLGPGTGTDDDVIVALSLLNKSLGLPMLTSKGAISKPAVTIQTATAGQLSTVMQIITSTSGTFYVNGGIVSTTGGGPAVVFPAPNNCGVDENNIMTTLALSGKVTTTVSNAAPALLTGAYAGLDIEKGSASFDPNDWAVATEAVCQLQVYLKSGLSVAKADAAIQNVVLKVAFAPTSPAILNAPVPVVTAVLSVSDPSAIQEAILLSKVIGDPTVSSTLQALGQAIETSDSNVIFSTTVNGTQGGSNFVEELYNQSATTKLSISQQEAFIAGLTTGETSDQLATTATNIALESATAVASGLKSDSVSTLESIAAGLLISGSAVALPPGGAQPVGPETEPASILPGGNIYSTVVGVTEGIINTTAESTPKAIATFAVGLIGLVPNDAPAIAPAAAQVAGTGNVITVADILESKTVGGAAGTVSLLDSVIQGVIENPIAYGSDTQGQFFAALSAALANQKTILAPIVATLDGFDGLTTPQLASYFVTGAPKLDVFFGQTLENLDVAHSAQIAYAAGAAVAGTSGTNDKALYSLAEAMIATDGSDGADGQGVAVSSTLAGLVSLAEKVTYTSDIVNTVVKSGTAFEAYLPSIAEGIAQTVNDAPTSLPTDLSNIAFAAAKPIEGTSAAVTTATGTEEIALLQGADPVVTGTAYANAFYKYGGDVVGIATTAAQATAGLAQGGLANTSVLKSASVGVGIDLNKNIYGNISLTGSVAGAVAAAAAQYVVPGSFEQLVDNNNYSYYTIAGIYGGTGLANPKLAADFPNTTKGNGIASALAAGIENPSGNQAAAAIAYDLAEPYIAEGYSTSNAALIQQIAVAVTAVDKNAVCDIFGYIAEALYEANWPTADIQLVLYGKGSSQSPTSVTNPGPTSLVAMLETASGGSFNSLFPQVVVVLANFDLGGVMTMPFVTADETPVVNF